MGLRGGPKPRPGGGRRAIHLRPRPRRRSLDSLICRLDSLDCRRRRRRRRRRPSLAPMQETLFASGYRSFELLPPAQRAEAEAAVCVMSNR